jgi:6-phosphogluconolactonase
MDNLYIFDTPAQQAQALVDRFCYFTNENLKIQDHINIALSGGSTPAKFFQKLAKQNRRIPWENLHLFWVDERCVAPDNADSNYGMTKKYLLDKVNIPAININRIVGEATPESEEKRYSRLLLDKIGLKDGWPVFDWILLGLGEDGHTASLFPGSPLLEEIRSITKTARHPISGQRRITLTFPVLNHAKTTTFLVSGSSKSEVIRNIFKSASKMSDIPATRIVPVDGIVEWYLDKDAAAGLD